MSVAPVTTATRTAAGRTAARVLLALTVALAVAGCGVRGALEAPSGGGGSSKKHAQADSGQGKKADEAPKPHKDFILDGLLR